MAFGKDAAAALVFLILYFAMFCYMAFMYATKRLKWASRFTILFAHCIIRLASQSCGVAFGVLVWRNVDVFVAFLILSAEGYFSLTIASYYFLKHFEIHSFGKSRLGPEEVPKGAERRKRGWMVFAMLPAIMPWKFWHHDLIAVVDSWLIPANAIIIAGGSMMTSANSDSSLTPAQVHQKLNTAKALRTTGQAIFLVLTVLFNILAANAFRKGMRARVSTATCKIFTAVGLLLLARGIFGVLQAVVTNLSYFTASNYDGNGMTSRFVALEYCLTAMPEWTAAALLNASYWTTIRTTRLTEIGMSEREPEGKNSFNAHDVAA